MPDTSRSQGQNLRNLFPAIFQENTFIQGPHRVFPGRLSVSRTFGDVEGKLVELGGNPKVLVSTPDISSLPINDQLDFVVLACDGVFDKLDDKDINELVWSVVSKGGHSSVHEACAHSIELIMKESLRRKTLDNVTVVMIAFEGFEKALFEAKTSKFVLGPLPSALMGTNDIEKHYGQEQNEKQLERDSGSSSSNILQQLKRSENSILKSYGGKPGNSISTAYSHKVEALESRNGQTEHLKAN